MRNERSGTRADRGIAWDPRIERADDWAELCTYIDGEHREMELTAMQLEAVNHVLGLHLVQPWTDAELLAMLLKTEESRETETTKEKRDAAAGRARREGEERKDLR